MVVSFGALGNPLWTREVQSLAKLHRQYSKDGLVVVAVFQDQDKKAVKAFAQKQKLSFIITIDQKSLKGAERYKISTMPTTYFLDRQHKVAWVQVGFSETAEPAYRKQAARLIQFR
ncbi:MAG: TlpA family protein disulfide reductase [Armatimonadetes bacterium]|nr:TlpA family protein disulfide reductase [Armatimonadota bacterium]